MEDQTNEPQDVEETEVEEIEEEAPEPTDDINELKTRLQRLEEKSITQRERTRLLKQELEKARKAAAPKEVPSQEKKTGELDNADYALLTVKGIEDDDEIEFIHKQMKKWDMPLRDVLKDEDVKTKLSSMRQAKEVAAATPSSTKRAGSQTNEVEVAIAKYEQTGKLPDDFELRSKVIDAKYERENSNKPPWQR